MFLYVIDAVSEEWLGEIEVNSNDEILGALEDSDYIEGEDIAALVDRPDGEYHVQEHGKVTLWLTHNPPPDEDDEDNDDFEEDSDDEDSEEDEN